MPEDRIELMGAPGSPYTRKMLALLRFRRIPHNFLLGSHRGPGGTYPEPKVKLLPTFYFPNETGALEAVVDSTPIARRLEKMYQGRSVIPADPVLSFLNYLIEDFADEWLTKAMFHYRWYYDADVKNAGPLLVYWQNPVQADADAQGLIDFISQRQVERLYVVGSNDVTAATIEDSYKRIIAILNDLVATQGYVLGARPATADFALYGQLTQLGIVDPTPAAILQKAAPRLRAWLDRVDDLSGETVGAGGWLAFEDASTSLKPLLAEIGRVYVPFLIANAKAVQAGEKSFETTIDGRAWTQPTFPYQAKCLGWIRQEFEALPDGAREKIRALLAQNGCAALLS